MDDESRRSNRELSVLGEDRCENRDVLFKPLRKQAIGALKRKMEGFENQMATIRARLEARRELTSSERTVHLPVVKSSPKNTAATTDPSSSTARMKFPLLQRIEGTRVANAPPKDPFLEVENVIHRTATRDIYTRDADTVTTTELAVASATKEAQQLSEEARKRMVAYSQNENGWRFEERTSRYQEVMNLKQQAEKAQQDADRQRETARQMKALLQDPYRELRSTPVPRNLLTLLPSSPFCTKQHEWIWVLASPSTKLTFTPRNETTDTVINNEKELSMFVVYYIAASDVNTKRVETEEQWQHALNNDSPPTTGWICYSVHGTPPAPELTSVKSGIQTWTVTGAGTGHLNGKYVASGVHNRVRKFKSSAGVELFRKCVPVASSLGQTLYGGQSTRPQSARSMDSITKEEHCTKEDKSKTHILPSGLEAIEKDELDFKSMQRVGSWLSMNESIERNRRMLATRGADDESNVRIDGSSVMTQESRVVSDDRDLVESRPQVDAPLCREWVLLSRCSRRKNMATNEPAKKGIGLGCLQRHYYISFEEKREMTVWVQTKESWLEKNVLAVIIEREAQMERVHHLSRKCMIKFQQNLRAETEKSKINLLAELNRVRFLTVRVLETIDRWRQHARKIGFARYDSQPRRQNNPTTTCSEAPSQPETEAPLLGWSASITLDTGKQLYKGTSAFVSKVKRFRRSEDITGKREQHIVYLGYFETQEEAERAYDEHAASEARRLNTTVEHLPHRRNVFRSCGKHFAVESEKNGPSFCIECKTKQLASLSSAADDWIPPFFYGTGVNYIMKMANDLDFLDEVLPLKTALNSGRGGDDDAFPMHGNVFLLPKTPIQDPNLAVFTTFPTPTAPRLGATVSDINDIDEEALGRDRILRAQQIFLQELQIYQSEMMDSIPKPGARDSSLRTSKQESSVPQYRLVEALYWDHCAALKIQQERPLLALRQPNVWCRPDAGEWAGLVVRGTHQQHFLFEEKLEKSGKEMVQKRQQVLAALRQQNQVPLYFVRSRTHFTELIAAGQQVRGDVVQLEVNNATKRLRRYDIWCTMSLVVQRWFRGVLGRQRARATRRALRLACKLRVFYFNQVAAVANSCYDTVRTAAVRRAYKKTCTPVYSRAVVMDGEPVIVSFHSLRHYQVGYNFGGRASTTRKSVLPSSCCTSCARRFHVKAHYQAGGNKFAVYRGVCTCHLNGGSILPDEMKRESWLIRAYSSSHNVIYRLRLETAQLQQLLSSQALFPYSSSPSFCPLILDMELKQLEAATASRYATFCGKNAETAATNLANWRRMNSEATQIRKFLLITLEKSLTLLDTTKHAHVVAVGNAKKALDFTSRPFSEAQAWDPLENANDWRFIVEKRQLTKRLEDIYQEVARLRVAYFQATYNEQYSRAGADEAQDRFNRVWLPLAERANRCMEEALLLETSTRTRMETVMEQLCSRFLTLRDGYLAPTRRNLVIQSPLWNKLAPFRIDIPGLRRRLNHLRRRTLVLSNSTEENTRTRRLVVTVSMSPIGERGSQVSLSTRDIWVTAYDPVDCSVHSIFLEWELVQLLTGSSGRKESSQSKRSAWKSIAEKLLSLATLDRFTGEFTLLKLEFYHTLRQLSPQFLSSRVMRDLQRGRKCGQGDEILRQAVSVDGRLCVVVVYENWGDLTFAIYHSKSGDFFRLVMSLSEVFDILSKKPLMLRLWVCCVKSNSYSSTLLVYLLKHVRFSQLEDGSEDIRIDHALPAQQRSKRYQTVIRMQKRQVLVSIVEDSAGDFQISGYDMSSELTYKLLLEREALRRALKTSSLPDLSQLKANLATSSSSLLLRRNRTLLYEWICSRLRFQSLLEHPEMVTSGTSPLLFGLHLRESFRILNRWIETSPRNPIRAVPEDEITRRASMIDVAVFSSLQFDQLTLMADPRLPFQLDNEFIGTMDWIEAVAGASSSSQTWRKQLPFMRIDFFTKAHKLFGRVRGELEAETKERKKRETRAGMEKEDRDALCLEISDLITSAQLNISVTYKTLFDLYTAATRKMDQWRRIHAELQLVTTQTEVYCELFPSKAPLSNAVQMFQEDNDSVLLDCISLWVPTTSTGLHEFIFLAVPFDSWCPLAIAPELLQVCLNKLDLQLKPVLGNFELVLEKIAYRDKNLEALRMHKKQISQFCNFVARQTTIYSPISVFENDTKLEEANVQVERQTVADSLALPADLSSNSLVKTGILIPSNVNEAVEEVFLDMQPWTPSEASPFELLAQTLITHLRSFFQQQQKQLQRMRHTSTAHGELTCQRVPYGVLVYQDSTRNSNSWKQSTHFNPRGVALTGGGNICGPALFWPFQMNCDWYRRLLDCSAIYSALATRFEDPALEGTTIRRLGGARSTKYLPWKQFAIERLRVSQTVKRSRVTEGVCINFLKSDTGLVAKEKRTVTTFEVGFRQLEISFGKPSSQEFCGNTSVIKCMKNVFALHPKSDNNSVNWQVSIDNPRILRNVLDVYDADGNAVQIPCLGCDKNEGFRMEAVQVALDNADNPRGLVFSYREVRTQRTYFVDCDYHFLQRLLNLQQQKEFTGLTLPTQREEEECKHQVIAISVRGWRKLASQASRFLVFRKKNGALSLCLEFLTTELKSRKDGTATSLSEGESNATEASQELSGIVNNTALEKLSMVGDNFDKSTVSSSAFPVQRRCRADVLEERRAVQRSMMRHFQKHQLAIRAAACGRILAAAESRADIRSSEWMQMMREDWRSQELRGLLGLDDTVLNKLENAYTPATRRAREYLMSSTKGGDIGGLELQMKEIAKAMDQTTLQLNEIETLQSFRMKRWKRRGKEANAAAKRAEASLADVAEWWRWRLANIQSEKATKL
ncbi:hypothetical protein GN244_ATG11358 [Phytophthora infestans]|uniref:Uncharacterized protein n=1 Tax=Phytophthora infestans TaxID=4787 RepID=A0A833SM41_PHYIN|nr:hypothetical protein GN244_ATG11358 [Phytophthora infestans]